MERALLTWTRACLAPRTRSFRVAADAMETKLPIYKNEDKMFRTIKSNAQTKTKVSHTTQTITTSTATGHKKTFTASPSAPLNYSTSSSSARATDRRFYLLEHLLPKFLLPKQKISSLSKLLLYYKEKYNPIIQKFYNNNKSAKWLIDNGGSLGLYQCFIMLACTAFCGWQFWQGNWTEENVKTTLEHYNFPLIRNVEFREKEKRFHDRVKIIGNVSLNPVKLNALMDGYAVADALVIMQIIFMFCTFPLVKHVKTPTFLRHVVVQMKR